MQQEIKVETHQQLELIDITREVENAASKTSPKNGLCLVFVPHSTCAILLTENESGLKKDWLSFIKKITSGINYHHNLIDDNAEAHLIAGLIGQGKTISVMSGRLCFGTWQKIFLVELDGPRERKVFIQTLNNS